MNKLYELRRLAESMNSLTNSERRQIQEYFDDILNGRAQSARYMPDSFPTAQSKPNSEANDVEDTKMTKSDFILSLSEALADLPGQERVRVLEYYEEMIDDRIENGMAEEEAVAAMGSIEEILKEAAPDALKARRECSAEIKPSARQISFCEPIEALIANSVSADLHVLRSALPDGVTARIDYELSENEQCDCTLNSGRLEVRYKALKQGGFSIRDLFTRRDASITITLAEPELVCGELDASSGSIDLSDLVFTHSLKVKTASGELDAHDVAIQGSCQLHTASGDITTTNLTCSELLELHTASGDLEISKARAGKIDIGTASGDIKFGSSECDELHCGSASGDIEVHDARSSAISLDTASGNLTLADSQCSGCIDLHSNSGDIQIRDTSCTENIHFSSTSGDISGRLIPVENYRFSARSRTGDVKTPHYDGICPVTIHTNSGDITFKAY